MTTHENILRLLDTLETRDRLVGSIDKEWYNVTANLQMDAMYQFVAFHYASATRTDTPYWYDVVLNTPYAYNQIQTKNGPINGPNNALVAIGKDIRGIHDTKESLRELDGYMYVLFGQDYTMRTSTLCDWFTWEDPQHRAQLHRQQEVMWVQYQQHRKKLLAHIETLPTHHQFLKENIYGEKD